MSGLPGPLPAGERILWQGRPDWHAVMRRIFHLRALAAYFGAIILWSTLNGFHRGASLGELAASTGLFTAAALVPLALMTLYAWGIGRSTNYTITNRRVAIRFGMALPMTVNLPYARIDAAGYRPAADGTGDIALQLVAGDKLAYLIMWPHARPWRVRHPEPMLRCLPNADRAAQILSRALAAAAQTPATVIEQLQPHAQPGTIRPQPAAA